MRQKSRRVRWVEASADGQRRPQAAKLTRCAASVVSAPGDTQIRPQGRRVGVRVPAGGGPGEDPGTALEPPGASWCLTKRKDPYQGRRRWLAPLTLFVLAVKRNLTAGGGVLPGAPGQGRRLRQPRDRGHRAGLRARLRAGAGSGGRRAPPQSLRANVRGESPVVRGCRWWVRRRGVP